MLGFGCFLCNRDGSGNPGTGGGLSLGVRNCSGQPGFFWMEKTLSVFGRLKGLSVGKKIAQK
jgi:hypothetical protein